MILGFMILSKDFSSLNSDHWLTDTIIGAYLTSFVDKEKVYVLRRQDQLKQKTISRI